MCLLGGVMARTVDAALLSFIAAFVDTACFVGLFGLFTAHVTGNFVLIGAALLARDAPVLAKLLALPVFALAVVCATMLVLALRKQGRARVPLVLNLEAGLLLATVAVIAAGPQPLQADAAAALAGGMLAVAAMGLQNALMRLELTGMPSTTVMTGNVTQLLIDAVTVRATTDENGVALRRMAQLWPGIASFTAGAAAGAASYAVSGIVCLTLPAALCLLLAWRLR